MAASLDVTMVLVGGEGVSTGVTARAWVYHDGHFGAPDTRQLTVHVGDRLTLQGPAADMLALVDRIRDALLAEVGRAWPVEQQEHAAVGA